MVRCTATLVITSKKSVRGYRMIGRDAPRQGIVLYNASQPLHVAPPNAQN